MKTKITTDYHIAVRRISGTTTESQQELRQYLRDSLASQLDDNDHLIAGDLFNDFTVDTSELLETYSIFSKWLKTSRKKLALVRGNHDYSVRGTALSSFDLLGTILKQQFPDQVTVANEVTEWKQFVLVPHLPNNEILGLEIAKLKDVSDKVVAFHANVDNLFAADSQHSLNLTLEQIEGILSKGNLVVCGHEHQHRRLCGNRCLVLGNTVPSSVSDCIGSPLKYAAMISGTEYELQRTWVAYENYTEVDWQDLDVSDKYQFIRVVGNATAEESASVIKAISQLRQRSNAYVITNAVKVEGHDMAMSTESVENIKAFDVMAAIFAELNEREIETVKELMK